ncbi:DUF6286 domain-containing protein [Kitasatospora sp. NPDC088391]|uniref:DUF6286 domain-containing protein n=1 Tax=Kitasatospora sp. NPDC088391 TaxID=3364074 RepID=UPI003818064F
MTGPEPGPPPAAPAARPDTAPDAAPPAAPAPRPRGADRWLRSARTAPTALVVVVALVAAGTLLYDVIAVRAGGQARPWRQDLARELATRHLDDPWVLGCAGGAAALGLVLLWLALAHGRHGWLPLEPEGSAIHRDAIGALIADRARRRADVHSWQVRAGRRRVRVTLTGTADPAGAERDLRAELARVPLAVPYRLDVRSQVRKERHHRRELAELEPPR